MVRSKLTPTALAARSLMALALAQLPGCQLFGAIQVMGIFIAKPQLTVRDSTEITVEAQSFRPGSTLKYRAIPRRGRIVQKSDTDKTFTYFAPYTSRFPDAAGNQTIGDSLEIVITDGFSEARTTQQINLTGSTLIFKGEDSECANETSEDCNGPLYTATVDDAGASPREIKPLLNARGHQMYGSQPAIAPDGRRVSWVLRPRGGTKSTLPRPQGGTTIYVMDAGGVDIPLTGGGSSSGDSVDPTWSPSGNELVFSSNRAGSYDLYFVSVGQANLPASRLTLNAVDERYPAWNPNPQHKNTLAVSVRASSTKNLGTAEDSGINVMLFDLQSRTYTKVLTNHSLRGDYAVEPRWKSDGIWLAYTNCGVDVQGGGGRFQKIWVQDSNSSPGSGKRMNPLPPNNFVAESNAAWSANGTNEIVFLEYPITEQCKDFGVPGQAQTLKGFPNLARPDGGSSGSPSGAQSWPLGVPVPTIRINGTQFQPVGGWSMDWR